MEERLHQAVRGELYAEAVEQEVGSQTAENVLSLWAAWEEDGRDGHTWGGK